MSAPALDDRIRVLLSADEHQASLLQGGEHT